MLCLMNGNASPLKLEPPPKQAIIVSGYSPAISICFSASSPITVWCRDTWLSTEPKAYLQLGVVIANSMASDIAVPKEPLQWGSFVSMSLPARVDIEGLAVTCAPNVSIMLRR